MKNFNPITFAIILTAMISSCSSKNMGLFNTTNPKQAVKENLDHSISPAFMATGAGKNKTVAKSKEVSSSPLHLSPITFSKENTNTNSSATPTNNVWSAPIKITKEEKIAIKNSIKETFKQNKKNETSLSKGVLVIIAILLPPVAVALVDGITGPFWLSILLTLLFYLPGLIYALYRIFRAR